MKIKIFEKEEAIDTKIEFYNSISRIPLDIEFKTKRNTVNFARFEILNDGNFLEFRFDNDTLDLIQITVVSLAKESISENNNIKLDSSNIKYASILLNEPVYENERQSIQVKIERSSNAISFNFGGDNLKYYRINEKVFIGIDNLNSLGGFAVKGLTKENIFDVFGY